MQNNVWQLQDAKSKFSQLVNNAMLSEPQFVTKHGSKAVVILSYAEYQRMLKPETDLVSFLQNSPLADAELDINRNSDLPRDINL